VKVVGSRRPVGKVGETHGVFPGLPIGDRAWAVSGDRRSRLSTNSQHRLGIASGGHLPLLSSIAEVSLVRCAPAECLMRTSQIIPVEELCKAALLFDAIGGLAQVDPFVLHGPPLADVLARIADHPARRIAELLPRSWQPLDANRAAA
jgi:hypothetical protein